VGWAKTCGLGMSSPNIREKSKIAALKKNDVMGSSDATSPGQGKKNVIWPNITTTTISLLVSNKLGKLKMKSHELKKKE
jgi:hypothetical protein